MLGKYIEQIQKNSGDDAVTAVCLSIMNKIKNIHLSQQKQLTEIIEKKYPKIEKERLKKKKKTENAIIFFQGVYTGEFNKKKLPHGKGTLIYKSRDKNYPDENDIYIGEFNNGTKTGIGQYTYWNERNIAKHPTTIPYYIGEWSGDMTYGLGKKIIDNFDDLQIFEGQLCNDKIFGFGKYTTKKENGEIELYGYFDDGQAVCFGIRIEKDNKNKVIQKSSGLVEYDLEAQRAILHFSFPSEDFWDVLDGKSKKVPIIDTIFNSIVNDGYFKQDIFTEKFKKKKEKIQCSHLSLLFDVNSFWNKNYENKKYASFVDEQREIMSNFKNCQLLKELNDYEKIIDEKEDIFKSIKKSLLK